jgi:hypothetical protein
MTTWYTADADEQDRLLAAWKEAPVENLEVLGMLLDTAKDQVIAFAPEDAVEASSGDIPSNLVLAQLRQAQNLLAAGTVSSMGDIGDGAFTFTPRPMDKTIRQIIRPVDGKPHVL